MATGMRVSAVVALVAAIGVIFALPPQAAGRGGGLPQPRRAAREAATAAASARG